MANVDFTEALTSLMQGGNPFHIDVIGAHQEFQCSLRFAIMLHPSPELWIFRESRDEIEASSFTLYSASIRRCRLNRVPETPGGHLVADFVDSTIIIELNSGTTVAIAQMKIPS